MPKKFDAATMLEALDRLAQAVIDNGVKLDVAVYGGSALMLASNFRYASEDVDAKLMTGAYPEWLNDAVERIGMEMRIAADWFNDEVLFHLSKQADDDKDHILFGTFPRGGNQVGLRILIPSAEYMLALKLKAMRINDPVKGEQETADIVNLMEVVGCKTAQEAVAIMGKFFPVSAESPEKQLFLIRHLSKAKDESDAPKYPIGSM